MLGRYILVDGVPVIEPDLKKWALWMDAGNRILCQTSWETPKEKILVSTVFLGIDHGFHPPVLWETMIFGGKHDEYQVRYSSLADAKEGHSRAVALAKRRNLNLVKKLLKKLTKK